MTSEGKNIRPLFIAEEIFPDPWKMSYISLKYKCREMEAFNPHSSIPNTSAESEER